MRALTPKQQIESLRAAIADIEREIDACEPSLVDRQVGMTDGEVDDPVLIWLHEIRKKFQQELDTLLKKKRPRLG
jgi:hypothetical protein